MKTNELNLHLIQYCKDNEISLEKCEGKYEGWYIVPLKNVEEIRIEIKKYNNEKD